LNVSNEENTETVTQEFHISVTPVGSDEYLVRTERVAPGVPLAEEQVVWAVDEWLAQARQLMNNPLLELLQGNGTRVGGFELHPRRESGDVEATLGVTPTLIELGQTLYNNLFQGTLRDSWMTARGIAQHKGEMLRLRLGLKGAKLPRLPWEVLNAGEREGLSTVRRPIATGTDVVFSRYTPGIGMTGGYLPPLERNQPIRILMAIAAPTDKEQLELKREAINLQQELQQARPHGDSAHIPPLELTVLEQPGREELTQALEQGHYHILHYAGHSNLGISGGNLYLVNRRTGLTEVLSGDDLAGLLVNNGIRTVVFNSCRGAHSAVVGNANGEEEGGEGKAERNLAEALVGRGIPAVLAMAEKIPDDVALTLTRLFYRNLKQGYPLDLSLSRARQGLISAYSSHQFYWALPVLYLHPEWDGYLVSGARDRMNPADRLLLAPQVYDHPPTRSGDSPASPPPPPPDPDDELEMISRAVLLEDDLPPVQPPPLPAPDALEPLDDLFYEESSDMADLLKQLTPDTEATPEVRDEEELLPQEPEFYPGLYEPSFDYSDALTEPTPALLPIPEARPVEAPPLGVMTQGFQDSLPGSQAIAPRWRSPYLLLPLVGAATMVIGVGVVQLLNRPPAPGQLLPAEITTSPIPTIDPNAVNLQNASTDDVTLVAMDRFSQGDLPKGGAAIVELLNRSAIEPANTALRVLSPEQVGDPEMLFLRGRVAWQAMAQGNTDYANDDALRYWKTAVEKKPDSAQYRNALGFAHYRAGELAEAVQSWCQAITLTQDPNAFLAESSPSELKCPMPTGLIENPVALPSYAGIALAFQKATTVPDFSQTPNLSDQAKRLHQLIIRSNPKADDPTTLPDGWLWTTELIQEWQALRDMPLP